METFHFEFTVQYLIYMVIYIIVVFSFLMMCFGEEENKHKIITTVVGLFVAVLVYIFLIHPTSSVRTEVGPFSIVEEIIKTDKFGTSYTLIVRDKNNKEYKVKLNDEQEYKRVKSANRIKNTIMKNGSKVEPTFYHEKVIKK